PSLQLLNVKLTPALLSAPARAASSSSVRYTTALAPARASDNDRLTILAQFEGDDERWSAKLHASPRLAVRSENRSDQMAAAKKLTAAILAKRAAKGSRGKRTRPGPRQYTVAELERAGDRVAAAERRIDNDHTSNPHRGR